VIKDSSFLVINCRIRGGCKLQRTQTTNTIFETLSDIEIGITPWIILKFFILSIARSTCILKLNGVITHVSDLWSGSISDKQITKSSGLIDKCEPGDAIMGDKGFLISDFNSK
jgi:hypothetical protein